MEAGLLEKTGKSLEEWVALLRKQDLEKHVQMVAWLKGEHGMTHGYASLVAHSLRQNHAGAIEDDDLMQGQYAGKESLRPIHDQLVAAIQAFGADIEFVPKKANVSVRRKTQFALIQPTTKTRMDLGIKIKGKDPVGRLENSGPFGSMCTHRVRLETVADVDADVIGWLREAYEGAG
jgi:predicted transport protein